MYFTMQVDPSVAFAIREAKRSEKTKRLRAIVEDAPEPKRKKSRTSHIICYLLFDVFRSKETAICHQHF